MAVFTMPVGTTLVQRNVNPKKLIFASGCIAVFLLFAATMVEHNYTVFFILYALAFAIN